MKFRLELTIHRARTNVWKFFTDTEKTRLWQPSLQKIETMNGVTGQPGAISKWTYRENERDFYLMEKILTNVSPERFENQFENDFATNTVSNIFVAKGDQETLWVMETQYKFKTLLMKVLGPILKKNYVTRSQKEMERFKEMVEMGVGKAGIDSEPVMDTGKP